MGLAAKTFLAAPRRAAETTLRSGAAPLVLCITAFLMCLAVVLATKTLTDRRASIAYAELSVKLSAEDLADRLGVAANNDILTATLRDLEVGVETAAAVATEYGRVLALGGEPYLQNALSASVTALDLSGPSAAEVSLSGKRYIIAWRVNRIGDRIILIAPIGGALTAAAGAGYLLIFLAVAFALAGLLFGVVRLQDGVREARLQAEDNLEGERALAAAAGGAWRYDPDSRLLRLSASIFKQLGRPPAPAGLTVTELTNLVHPKDIRSALALTHGPSTDDVETTFRLRAADGGWQTFAATGAAVKRYETDRAPARRGVLMPLAERQAAETPASKTEPAPVLGHFNDAAARLDKDGALVEWNAGFFTLFQLTEKNLEKGLPAKTLAGVSGLPLPLLRGEEALKEPLELPDGRWAQVSRTALEDGGAVLLAMDVSALKRQTARQALNEQELKRMVADLERSRAQMRDAVTRYKEEKAKAEAASKSKSEFLANMSHELRTPLNAINGFSEIMQSELYGPLGDGRYKAYVADILASGRRLLDLIENVLDMSKIEAGEMQLDLAQVDLDRALTDALRSVDEEAQKRGITVHPPTGRLSAVWGDARAVRQIVGNIVSNAVKFAPEGGEVRIAAETGLDAIALIVSDNGDGLSPEDVDRLGAPFEVMEDHFSKQKEGSGLGLALSKALMGLQNGLMAIDTAKGQGTSVCLSFPRRPTSFVKLPDMMPAASRVLTDAKPQPLQAVS